MAIEIFNRYEHKYLLDRETFEKVIAVMDEHMELDVHNKNHETYTIANIYFDTDDNYLIRTSLSKPVYKEKLRLRSYEVPCPDTKVYLEIKTARSKPLWLVHVLTELGVRRSSFSKYGTEFKNTLHCTEPEVNKRIAV